MAIEFSDKMLKKETSIILNLLFFAQARDIVGVSRTQLSLLPALDEAMIYTKPSPNVNEIEISVSSLRNFLLIRFPAYAKIVREYDV